MRVFASRPTGVRFAGLLGLAMLAGGCVPPAPISSAASPRGLAVVPDDDPLPRAWGEGAVRGASGEERPAADADRALFAQDPLLERARLVAAVLERNPTLGMAYQAHQAALTRPAQASSLDDPMLGLGLAPLSFGSSRVDPAGRAELTQPIPFPGKRRLRGEAARAEAVAAGRDLESTRLDLAMLASQSFDDYVLAARAVEISREHVLLMDELRRLALARYATGQDAKQSVLQAEMGLARARIEQSELETAVRVVTSRINAMLHRVEDLPLPPAPMPIAAEALTDPPSESSVDLALTDRPELDAAHAREQAAAARVDLARRAFLPDFALVGEYNGLMQSTALGPYVGIRVDVPLQLGRRRAALAESRAHLATTRLQRAALEDDIRLATRTALLELDQARAAEQLVRDRLLPAATDQLANARDAYATGGSTFFALIDAARELHEVELEHARALASIARRRAALDRAVGRVAGLDW